MLIIRRVSGARLCRGSGAKTGLGRKMCNVRAEHSEIETQPQHSVWPCGRLSVTEGSGQQSRLAVWLHEIALRSPLRIRSRGRKNTRIYGSGLREHLGQDITLIKYKGAQARERPEKWAFNAEPDEDPTCLMLDLATGTGARRASPCSLCFGGRRPSLYQNGSVCVCVNVCVSKFKFKSWLRINTTRAEM